MNIKDILGVAGILLLIPVTFVALAFGAAYGFAGLGVLGDKASTWHCDVIGGSYEWVEGEYADYKTCVPLTHTP